jgi:hypothetical protein
MNDPSVDTMALARRAEELSRMIMEREEARKRLAREVDQLRVELQNLFSPQAREPQKIYGGGTVVGMLAPTESSDLAAVRAIAAARAQVLDRHRRLMNAKDRAESAELEPMGLRRAILLVIASTKDNRDWSAEELHPLLGNFTLGSVKSTLSRMVGEGRLLKTAPNRYKQAGAWVLLETHPTGPDGIRGVDPE